MVNARGDPIPGAGVARGAVPTYLPVGAALVGMAVTDGKGRFRLGEFVEGTVTLEAYAAYSGLTRSPVSVRPDRSFRSDPIADSPE